MKKGRVAGLESSYACGSSAQETRKQTNKGLPPSLYIIPLSSLSFCLSHVNFYLPSRRSIHSWSQNFDYEPLMDLISSPLFSGETLRFVFRVFKIHHHANNAVSRSTEK